MAPTFDDMADVKKLLPEGCALILEGGGSRGVFTAGVLDYFMERSVYFPYVCGVSAGACNALDYLSAQIGRSRDTFIIRDPSLRPLSLGSLIKTGHFYDMDKPFHDFPYEYFPFDFETYKNSGIKCEMVVFDIDTGKREYLSEEEDNERILSICRASSSLPLLTPPVEIDGRKYLDGGLADSIPYARSIMIGNKKHVVILTQRAGYRKESTTGRHDLLRIFYKDHPAVINACVKRPLIYNRQLDILERLEKEGRVFVIRPEEEPVDRLENDPDKLEPFYQHGYNVGVRVFDEMIKYLEA